MPIDIDTIYKLYPMLARGYYYCTDLNHMVYEYPVRLDIDYEAMKEADQGFRHLKGF